MSETKMHGGGVGGAFRGRPPSWWKQFWAALTRLPDPAPQIVLTGYQPPKQPARMGTPPQSGSGVRLPEPPRNPRAQATIYHFDGRQETISTEKRRPAPPIQPDPRLDQTMLKATYEPYDLRPSPPILPDAFDPKLIVRLR